MPTKEEIENVVIERTEKEFDIDVRNHDQENKDFQRYQSIYNLEPIATSEEWMSNTVLPEFLTEMTVQTGIEVAQEFRRRDYVEIYHESKEDEHRLAGEANKELINRVLNKRHVHYYQKRAKASGLKNMSGKVFFKCVWERKTVKSTEIEQQAVPLETPVPGGQQEFLAEVEVTKEEVIFDRWNLEVLDPRNVFLSPEVAYSVSDKKRVSIQYDTDINEMEESQEQMAYFNLDKVRDALENIEAERTDVEEGSESRDEPDVYEWTALKPIKAIEVHLQEWVLLSDDGVTIKPGIDGKGNPLKKKGAVLRKIIKAYVIINDKKILVRYQRYPFRDPRGNTYNPIVLGKCYIHPTEDQGFGDGKASLPLENARNGIFNMGINRVTLATLPTLKAGTNSAQEFRKTWNFEPNGIMEAYNPDDLQEFVISDDITGVNNIMGHLTSSQQAATASFPTAQGGLPLASTSATATVASEQRTDARQFYKGMTFDNTALHEIYDRIIWMYWQFALPETAERDFGEDKIINFNPFLDHTFKTVTEALETESSKAAKIQVYDNMFAQNAQIPNKNTLKLLNRINVKKFKLLGDEFEDVQDSLFDETEEFAGVGGQGSLPGQSGAPATNQSGIAQSGTEQQARSQTRDN